MVFYPNPVNVGTNKVDSLGDGYTISVSWYVAEHSLANTKIAYHIYYSTIKENVYTDGVKYVSLDEEILHANLIGLIPGQMYFVSVVPVEYDPAIFDLTQLPVAYDNLRFYPSSLLRADISATDTLIPLLDVEGFPNTGVIKVGVELIQYTSVDTTNNNVIVPSSSATDGYLVQQSNSYYYLPSPFNIGSGFINNLTLVDTSSPAQIWIIRCIFVQRDNNNHPIPGTAQFETIGSISGNIVDGYGDYNIWSVNGSIVSNGILSFSISEVSGYSFVSGDSFTVQVAGGTSINGGRGYNNTTPRLHTVSGFDGLNCWNSAVVLFTVGEDNRWDLIYACQSRFEYPNYAFTILDGYHQVTTDLLSTDLSASDAANVTFPAYDYAGYHRTDPVQLLDGTCVGSYIGGEMGCIDANGNFNILRGFSLQDQNTQRQEMKLTIDGKPAILIKRESTGITCSCYLPSSEHPDDRCPLCYGTKFVFGYNQYFNPRRSDGRILVRPSPTEENLKRYEAGMESEFPVEFWTLTVPTIKMRDILVLFDQDGNEEFRYEVAGVTRNNTILGLDGGQIMKTFRVRKFDPIYQIRIFRDSSDFPSTLNTSISFVLGIPPHSHAITINENIMAVSQINQTTQVSQGHNHPIVNGQVMEALGHTHSIILP
jgi:hypothetical protein